MKEPKYKLGQEVFVFECGMLHPKIISSIEIFIQEGFSIIGYYFKKEDGDVPFLPKVKTDEKQVYESKEDFIKSIQ